MPSGKLLTTLVIAASLFVMGSPAGAAGKATPKPLFVSIDSVEVEDLSSGGEVEIRSRLVEVDHKLLRKKEILLNLFDDTQIIAVRQRDIRKNLDRHAWVGHIPDIPDSEIILSVNKKKVAGTVRTGTKLFKIRPLGNVIHKIIEVPSVPPLPESDPVIPDQPAHDEQSSGDRGGSPETSGDDGTVIDVAVFYTPAARSANGGVAGVEALIDLAIIETNQAYVNSGVIAQLNLVHTAEVNYTESSSMSTDLNRLRLPGDGHMDEVHTLRDLYGADMVGLIEKNTQYCGIAYVMTTLSQSFASLAFSVTHWSCATGYYTFGHELGHNQGSTHDHDNGGAALYPYSYGYQQPSGNFRSVMAYNCTGGCARKQFFSNPDLTYNGFPTGVPDYADNARSINEAKPTISNWRQSVAVNPPADPSDLNAVAFSASQINLSWIDNADNETGYKIERSLDASNWTEIATGSADLQSYADTGLPYSTIHSYRVRAYNGAGNSGYSNIGYTTTLPLPLPGEASTPIPADGSINVDLNPSLGWVAGSDAGSHDVYFGTTSGALNYQGNQVDTSFDPGPLVESTTYYWRTDSVNATGTTPGVEWRFTTKDPLPPDVITVLEAGYKADRDEIKIRATSSEQPEAALTVAGLGAMTFKKDKYELKLRPLSPLPVPQEVTINSSYGGQITVPVTGAPPAPPPPTPSAAANPSPADGAVDVSTAITLGWTAGADTDSHDVYFGTVSGTYKGKQTGSSYNHGTLANNTTYYWRIDEVNAFGTTTGAEWAFTTVAEASPPGPPGSPIPVDNASQVPVNTSLNWTAGTQAETHDVYFGTVSPPPVVSSGQSGTSYTPTTLTYNTTYYWRVREINGEGNNLGPVWGFTTQDQNPADVISITKAEWTASKQQLRIEATSSGYPDAVLTVVGYGQMVRDGGKNKYRYIEKPVANPGLVTITSDQGGSAALAVKVK